MLNSFYFDNFDAIIAEREQEKETESNEEGGEQL